MGHRLKSFSRLPKAIARRLARPRPIPISSCCAMPASPTPIRRRLTSRCLDRAIHQGHAADVRRGDAGRCAGSRGFDRWISGRRAHRLAETCRRKLALLCATAPVGEPAGRRNRGAAQRRRRGCRIRRSSGGGRASDGRRRASRGGGAQRPKARSLWRATRRLFCAVRLVRRPHQRQRHRHARRNAALVPGNAAAAGRPYHCGSWRGGSSRISSTLAARSALPCAEATRKSPSDCRVPSSWARCWGRRKRPS